MQSSLNASSTHRATITAGVHRICIKADVWGAKSCRCDCTNNQGCFLLGLQSSTGASSIRRAVEHCCYASDLHRSRADCRAKCVTSDCRNNQSWCYLELRSSTGASCIHNAVSTTAVHHFCISRQSCILSKMFQMCLQKMQSWFHQELQSNTGASSIHKVMGTAAVHHVCIKAELCWKARSHRFDRRTIRAGSSRVAQQHWCKQLPQGSEHCCCTTSACSANTDVKALFVCAITPVGVYSPDSSALVQC